MLAVVLFFKVVIKYIINITAVIEPKLADKNPVNVLCNCSVERVCVCLFTYVVFAFKRWERALNVEEVRYGDVFLIPVLG